MIFNHAVNVGGFAYCTTYYGPHTTNTYYNANDGHYHSWLYIVDGSARAEVHDSADLTSTLVYTDSNHSPGTLLDVSASKDKYVTTTTENSSLSMMMFNPIPATRDLNIEIVKGTTTKTVTADNTRITVVCILGPITVNDKTVESLQHVKVFPGKTVTIALPEHTVCALVQDK
jgi:redox-sensitive bicupin YhaK (pirin superfamily)